MIKLKIKKLKFKFPVTNSGLTLIEIMVVVAILAIMTTGILTVFRGSLLSERRGTNKALVYSEARAALDMLSREIEKAFVDERIRAKCWGIDGGGDAPDTFLFIAPLNPEGDIKYPKSDYYQGELCEVGYWVTDNELIKGWSTHDNDFDLSDFGDENSVIDGVYSKGLQFQYFDESSQSWSLTGDWDDGSGNPTDILPPAIKITLVMEYEPEREVIRYDTFIAVVHIPGSGQ